MTLRVQAGSTTVRTSIGKDDAVTDRLGVGTKAAIFFMSGATADGTRRDHAHMSVGMTDGTNQSTYSIVSEDGGPNSNTKRSVSEIRCIGRLLDDGTAYDGTAFFDAFLDDDATPEYGTRIDWPSSCTLAHELRHLSFGGDDCEFQVVNFTSSSSVGGTVDVGSLGGKPDFGIVFGIGNSATSGRSDDAHMSVGFWRRNDADAITQRAYCHGENDGQSIHNPSATARTDSVGLSYTWSGLVATDNAEIKVTAINSDGVEITTSDFSVGYRWSMLLGRCKTKRIETAIVDLASLTAVGDQSITAPGFRPQAAFEIQTMFNSGSYNRIQNTNAETWSLGIHDEDGEFSSNYNVDDGQTTMNTASFQESKEQIMRYGGGSSAAGLECSKAGHTTAPGYTATGWNRNWSIVRPAAKASFALVFGDADVVSGGRAVSGGGGGGEARADAVVGGRAQAEAHARGEASAAAVTQAAGPGHGLVEAFGRGAARAAARAPGRSAVDLGANGSVIGAARAPGRASVATDAVGASSASAHLPGRGSVSSAARGEATGDATTQVPGPGHALVEAFARGDARGVASVGGHAPVDAEARGVLSGRGVTGGRGLVGLGAQGQASAIAQAAGIALSEVFAIGTSGAQRVKLFYETLAKLCRTAFRVQIGDALAVPVQYGNMPFTPPNEGSYIKVDIGFDRTDPLGLGSHDCAVLAFGTLTARLYGVARAGEGAILTAGKSVVAAFTGASQGRARFLDASLGARGRTGARYWVEVDCPFWADDEIGRPPVHVPGIAGDGGYDDACTVIRERVNAAMAELSIPVHHPNLAAPGPGVARYVELGFTPVSTFALVRGSTVREIGGIVSIGILDSWHVGEAGALELVDRIDHACRSVVDRGIEFEPLQPGRGMRKGSRWKQSASVRWRSQNL